MNNFDDVHFEWREMPFSKEIVKLYFWSSWDPAPLSPLICMTSPLHFICLGSKCQGPELLHPISLFQKVLYLYFCKHTAMINQCSLRGSTSTHVTIYVISSIHVVTACILEHAIISDSTFLSNQPIISSLVTKNSMIHVYGMMYIRHENIALKDALFYLQVKKTCSEL